MGRASRWLRGLFGTRKEKEPNGEKSTSPIGRKEKKRWSFGKSGRDSGGAAQVPLNIPTTENDWLRSYISETEKEQNKHAIAVAAATAAAADAAVAAAQAAVAVVRLTSHGRGTLFGGGRERWAVVKIQTVFRGYLARKALRALKGLVKLQALVRGYLVRKRATATLYSMQALIRAQATVRSQKARRFQHEFRHRKSIERLDETRSEFHSKRLSASLDASDESPKIVEIDTFKPKSRSRRTNTNLSISDYYGEDSFPFQPLSSPFPCPVPARLSIPDCRSLQDFEWNLNGEECRFSTAQSTPRFINPSRNLIPLTPAKIVCADSFYRPFSHFPNYMANTQSFNAKLRPHSAPKQRPEPRPKKMLSLNEIMESRSSLSGARMQRSCSHVQEALNF